GGARRDVGADGGGEHDLLQHLERARGGVEIDLVLGQLLRALLGLGHAGRELEEERVGDGAVGVRQLEDGAGEGGDGGGGGGGRDGREGGAQLADHGRAE